MLPIECVVRGYLSGSGWKSYQRDAARSAASRCRRDCASRTSSPSRSSRPRRRRRGPRRERHARAGGRARRRRAVRRASSAISLELYEMAAEYAASSGIIIADTKFELGLDDEGRLVLGDEAFTPDSSRFWPADEYEPGGPQPSFDKQFVRDYAESLGWDKTPPGPGAPGRGRRGHPRALPRGVRADHRDPVRRLRGRPRRRCCSEGDRSRQAQARDPRSAGQGRRGLPAAPRLQRRRREGRAARRPRGRGLGSRARHAPRSSACAPSSSPTP